MVAARLARGPGRRPRGAGGSAGAEARRGRGHRAGGRRRGGCGGRLLEPPLRRRGARDRHRGEGRPPGTRPRRRLVRGIAAVRALDRADRIRHAVLGLHSVLERLSRSARAAASVARTRSDGRARGSLATFWGTGTCGPRDRTGPAAFGSGGRPASGAAERSSRRFSGTTSATMPADATPSVLA